MIEGVQQGVSVPSMVLIMLMLMEGWYLSWNKVLFFDRDSCTDLVNEIVWDIKRKTDDVLDVKNSSSESYDQNWDCVRSGKLSVCKFQKFSKSDVSHLLNGSWVVVAGDSEVRLLVVSLLRLVLDEERIASIEGDWFKRHNDYKLVIDETGMTLDFIWTPYETNLTNLIMKYKVKSACPDVLVMGSGLWHFLHVKNASDYGARLQSLKNSVVSWVLPCSRELDINHPVTDSVCSRSPHLFWLGMPVLINEMLTTEAKRERMNDAMCHAYDKALGDSNFLPQTEGPLMLLDRQSLSQNCGPRCTSDGMHYNAAVYDVLVHIMLNALLNDSQQRL